MAYIQGKAPCLSFINMATHTLNHAPRDYVKIVRGTLKNPCYSQVGREGGEQLLGLRASCFAQRSDGTLVLEIAIHQLLHSFGYTHEMQRPDRDKHITLNTANILPGLEINFEKNNYTNTDFFEYGSDDDVDPKQTPYDRSSVMQWSPFDGANNPNEPVFTFNFFEDDYDEQDWPYRHPDDPMSVIDQVELLLGYRSEANCTIGEDLLVDYIHINRISLDLQMEDKTAKIENLTTRMDTMMEMFKKERENLTRRMETMMDMFEIERIKIIEMFKIERTKTEVQLQNLIYEKIYELKSSIGK